MTDSALDGRVARFKDLSKSPKAFVDTILPEHARDIYNVIGFGVTEDAALQPAIADAQDFNLTYVGADPGKGAALHDHPTVEVFVAMTGRWAIIWGEDGENETEIDPFDAVSVPPGIMRGFRNISGEHSFLMAILGGSESGKVNWATSVLTRAKEAGLELGADGNIIETD
ncbi:MAG: cupin domain-containing protein [Rhodospirillales bacterium]|nr:cupin domain-containing protein [Rhodospirillales bacterium]